MIELGAKPLTISEFKDIVIENRSVTINADALKKVENSFHFLIEFSKDKIIYGINTGFGPMAQYQIDKKEQTKLQLNLIRSHSSGSSEIYSPLIGRAIMLARLNTLLQGYSGIHKNAILILKQLINKHISPTIYKHGGVGASGDLVQLAHLALNMIGEGEMIFNNKIMPTKQIFEQQNIKPLKIHLREGLAIMNGTSVMTAVGIINILFAKKIIRLTVITSAIINEIMESYDDHFSYELNNVKMHGGQAKIAKEMREILVDSKLIRKREEHLFKNNTNQNLISKKVQEYYSLRCVPQILGAIADTIKNAQEILINEINSVNDNPIVDVQKKNVFHGGNFHGDYVALEMDKIKIAITKLSMLSERQLNFLLNDKLNEKLPPFVNLGKLGLNLGSQGTQFTATSTVAENQMLANPMYVHSIPNNNDNQDIVSMGSNAANITYKVIENTFEVLSILSITIAQSVDYLEVQDRLSRKTNDFFLQIRQLVPKFEQDSTKYKEIDKLKKYFMNITQ